MFRKKRCFTKFSTKIYRNGSLVASYVFVMSTQSIKFHTFHCHILKSAGLTIDCSKLTIENKRLLLSASFTAKVESVVLTKENDFSSSFHFKDDRKSIGSSKKTLLGIFKIALRLRDRHVFMWQSLEILNIFNILTFNKFFEKWIPFSSLKYQDWKSNISI